MSRSPRGLPRRSSFLGAVGVALAGCQTPESSRALAPATATLSPSSLPTGSTAITVQAPADFSAWLDGVRREAHNRGIGATTIDRALSNLSPVPRVLELDRRQPEFTQTFWRYIDSAVSAKRIATGRRKLSELAPALRQIEQQYGVPGRFLVAFWGLETNYGANLGGFSVIGALATLAFDGRRSAFFRGELLNALEILDRGHIAPSAMIGSWAGAMGQTQFMPSTFLKHAIDFDRDGRIDPWSSTVDALGSGANYLRALGWDGARTWGREVVTPSGFNVRLASIDTDATETVKPLAAWSALGVRRTDGEALPKLEVNAALILPAGAQGPAFLVYENYRTTLKWNRSTFYAVAIGHLADRIAGGPVLAAPRRALEPMTRADVVALQQVLASRGYLGADGIDGVFGAATRRAVRAVQIAKGLPADGYVDSGSLSTFLAAMAG